MKKTNRILAIILMISMLIGVLAGCGGDTTDPTGSAPAPTGGETVPGGEEPTMEEVLLQGIFKCTVEGRSNTAVIRFKEDGTFYGHGLDGQKAYIGKYELVEMEIKYVDFGDNGNWETEEGIETKTSKYAIAFYEADGVTPMPVRNDAIMVDNANGVDGSAINEGVDKCYVAYTPEDGKLHAVGFYGDSYTRTLTQDTAAVFTEADEVKNLLYHFMVAELPEWAVGEYEAAELEFKLYHNSYEDLATGEIMASGSLTANGNVYTLDNGATVTVDPDAYTAVYEKDGTQVQLVQWVQLGEVVATLTGELFNGAMTYEVKLYDDGNLVLTGNMVATPVNGTYSLNADNTLNVDITAGSMTVSGGSYDPTTKEVVIHTEMGAAGALDLIGTAEGTLFGGAEVLASVEAEVEMVPGYPQYNAHLTLNLNSNGVAEITMSGSVLATARWEYNKDTYSFDFYQVSNGTLSGALSAEAVTFTWVGDISENATGKEVVFPSETGIMANLQGDDLPRTKVLLTQTVPAQDPMVNDISIRFLSDGTGILTMTTLYEGAPVGGVTVTFDWALSATGCEFTNVVGAGDGASIVYAMNADYTGIVITFTMMGSSGEVSYDITGELTALSALKG